MMKKIADPKEEEEQEEEVEADEQEEEEEETEEATKEPNMEKKKAIIRLPMKKQSSLLCSTKQWLMMRMSDKKKVKWLVSSQMTEWQSYLVIMLLLHPTLRLCQSEKGGKNGHHLIDRRSLRWLFANPTSPHQFFNQL